MREPAPAAADLEHVIVGAELELVADPLGACARWASASGSLSAARRRRTSRSSSRRASARRARCRGRSGRRCCAGRGASPLRRFGRGGARVRGGRPRGVRRPRSALRSRSSKSADQIVGVPLVGHVRLAEPDRAARRDPAEEPRRGSRSAEAGRPEAPRAPAGKLDLERAAVEVSERALESCRRRALEQPAAGRHRLGADAHVRTDPSPGTNGGLWWNGTRLSQSRSACQWISAVTWSGCSG